MIKKIKFYLDNYDKFVKLLDKEKNFYYYTCPTDWCNKYYEANSTIEI